MTDPTTPDTALRERLARALHESFGEGGCKHHFIYTGGSYCVEWAMRILAALGPDATRMAAALGEGDRQSLMERVSLLPRFATNTGDYVDVEAVLDILREDPR